ncbi:MAG: RiPP maturation radical SAM C-methyltransferase [Acidobacteriota bacterium]
MDSEQNLPRTDVVLISMPFGPLPTPSIGLGLLKASLAPRGISSKTLYFSLRFAEEIGASLYALAAHSTATESLVGEWIFARALFGEAALDAEGYVRHVLSPPPTVNASRPPGGQPDHASRVRELVAARDKVERFLDQCLAEVLEHRPRIVGFTSVFLQHVASLALAKRLKARAPDTFILFGGANCEGIMGAEVIRQFPFVDAVVSGEGDLVFASLVERTLAGDNLSGLRGVFTQQDGARLFDPGGHPHAPSVSDMDALPVPDYDEFFEQWAASPLEGACRTTIQFETSRGCWWGQRHHCTFCGLNGASMQYRSKSAGRALGELLELTTRHPGRPVSVVDNILDLQYFKEFVPALAARQLDLQLFYEVKANLKKPQVRLLRDAGIRVIQPGIESFSDRVLEIMKKGERGLHNIQLLKWCKELGVDPVWNLLWGFPGEPPDDYRRMADLLPLLTHLAPPVSAMPLRLDRFSPNYERAEALGFVDVAPIPAYRYIYPFPRETVANLAYYFTYAYREPQDVRGYTRGVEAAVHAWRVACGDADLFSIDLGTVLMICDLRPARGDRLTSLTGLQRTLYAACDGAQSVNSLRALAADHLGPAAAAPDVESVLEPLLECGVMVRDRTSYLSLAVPVGEYAPSAASLARFHALLGQRGRQAPEMEGQRMTA